MVFDSTLKIMFYRSCKFLLHQIWESIQAYGRHFLLMFCTPEIQGDCMNPAYVLEVRFQGVLYNDPGFPGVLYNLSRFHPWGGLV